MAERAPEPGDVFPFASRRARVYAVLVPLFMGGLAALIGLVAPSPWRFLAVPGLFASSLMVWRAAHIALELSYEGVVVRNTYRTYEFRWGNIRHVYLGGGVGWGHCVAFALKDVQLGIEADATSDAWRDERLGRQLRRYSEAHGIQLASEFLDC